MNLDGEAGASPDDPYAFLRAMPAMMSFKALLISALVKSLTRRVPTSGMIWRSILPVSVPTEDGFFDRPPFPR